MEGRILKGPRAAKYQETRSTSFLYTDGSMKDLRRLGSAGNPKAGRNALTEEA